MSIGQPVSLQSVFFFPQRLEIREVIHRAHLLLVRQIKRRYGDDVVNLPLSRVRPTHPSLKFRLDVLASVFISASEKFVASLAPRCSALYASHLISEHSLTGKGRISLVSFAPQRAPANSGRPVIVPVLGIMAISHTPPLPAPCLLLRPSCFFLPTDKSAIRCVECT